MRDVRIAPDAQALTLTHFKLLKKGVRRHYLTVHRQGLTTPTEEVAKPALSYNLGHARGGGVSGRHHFSNWLGDDDYCGATGGLCPLHSSTEAARSSGRRILAPCPSHQQAGRPDDRGFRRAGGGAKDSSRTPPAARRVVKSGRPSSSASCTNSDSDSTARFARTRPDSRRGPRVRFKLHASTS